MKKIIIGFSSGLLGGAINILFLLFASGLETEVYLSTLVTWLAIGILTSSCSFKLNGLIKGIIVSILVSASSLIYTITSSIAGAVWSMINTIIVGALLGYLIDKITLKLASKNHKEK